VCLDRLVPPVRAKDETVEVGQTAGKLSDRGQAILDASLTGRITPNQAATLMQVLMTQVRVVEADELALRLEALEHKVNRPR
jgi:hypothetical protein